MNGLSETILWPHSSLKRHFFTQGCCSTDPRQMTVIWAGRWKARQNSLALVWVSQSQNECYFGGLILWHKCICYVYGKLDLDLGFFSLNVSSEWASKISLQLSGITVYSSYSSTNFDMATIYIQHKNNLDLLYARVDFLGHMKLPT